MFSSFNHFCFTPLLVENLFRFLIKTGQYHQHQTLQGKAELVDNDSKKIYHVGLVFFGWVRTVPFYNKKHSSHGKNLSN